METSSTGGIERDDRFHRLRGLVARLARVAEREVDLETSVVDELNLDSLKLIDLTFALEEAFGIAEFPMQQWYDAEAAQPGKRFTVASLLRACERCGATLEG